MNPVLNNKNITKNTDDAFNESLTLLFVQDISKILVIILQIVKPPIILNGANVNSDR